MVFRYGSRRSRYPRRFFFKARRRFAKAKGRSAIAAPRGFYRRPAFGADPKPFSQQAINLTTGRLGNPYGGLWPARLRCQLEYNETLNFASTAGALAGYTFGANCLFDPDISGTGHQPRGYDQISAMYFRYVVLGAKITIHGFPSSTITSIPISQGRLSIASTTLQTLLSDGTSLSELPGAVHRFVGYASQNFTGLSLATRTGVANGETQLQVITGDSYNASTGANPADITFFQVYYQSTDQAATGNCSVWIKITYDCLFTERTQPAAS